MKKLFLAAVLTATLTAACSKNESEGTSSGKSHEEGAKIEIAFAPPAVSRAFGNGETQEWEKQVFAATVFVFSDTGNIKFRRELTTSEIANATTAPIHLSLPGFAAGASTIVAVVANRTVPQSIVTVEQLQRLEESDFAAYNGAFADVAARALRPGGFVMMGTATPVIADGTTQVAITLERVVAKIEISTAVTPTFNARYAPATILVEKATMINIMNYSCLFPSFDNSRTLRTSCEQATVQGQNLFYLFSNRRSSAADNHCKIHISAKYDADGNPATTTDQSPVEYDVTINDRAEGEIRWNGAYKINANINGLTGNDVAMTFVVTSWETLVTQNVELGN